MSTQKIRFIDSSYRDLFQVEDDSVITIEFNGEISLYRAKFIDGYHLYLGHTPFHICEFAEKAERNSWKVYPETLSEEQSASWQFKDGNKKYLSVQSCDAGWDYSLYNEILELVDDGHLDDPKLKIEEARSIILNEILGLNVVYMEKVFNFEKMLEERINRYPIKNSSFELLTKMMSESEDCFGIFSLPLSHCNVFTSLDALKNTNQVPQFCEFNGIYMGKLEKLKGVSAQDTLKNIYKKFNTNIPEDYRDLSLSVGDVIVLKEEGGYKPYMVGNCQFDHFSEFLNPDLLNL